MELVGDGRGIDWKILHCHSLGIRLLVTAVAGILGWMACGVWGCALADREGSGM